MKKTLLIASALVGLLAETALATIDLHASSGTAAQTLPLGNFDVTIQLTVTGTTPPNVDGFNLWLETAAANNNLFKVLSVSTPQAWGTPAGGTVSNDVLTTTGSTHATFAQNTTSLGFVDSTAMSTGAVNTPTTNLVIETIHMGLNQSAGSYALNTPYTFAITNATTSSPRTSGINDNNGNFSPANTTGSFTVTFTAVPEPATWSLLGLGGLGTFGLNLLRARRRS